MYFPVLEALGTCFTHTAHGGLELTIRSKVFFLISNGSNSLLTCNCYQKKNAMTGILYFHFMPICLCLTSPENCIKLEKLDLC